MKYCPLCQKRLEVKVEEYRSGDVIDDVCPTMVPSSYNGKPLSHFQSGGISDRTLAVIPPFRFWRENDTGITSFDIIHSKGSPTSFTHILDKSRMSIEEAVETLKRLVNMKAFT